MTAGLVGCADKFTLPPVPDAEIPQPGAYNFDREWFGMGEIQDMVVAGGLLYTLTRRDGVPRVEAWLSEASNPTQAPPLLAGQPIESLRRPVALVRFTEAAVFLHVADDRGPDVLEGQITCPRGGPSGCYYGASATAGGSTNAILSKPFEPVVDDFTLTARVRVSEIREDGSVWLVLGTAPGRIGTWLEIDGEPVIRPVRSDGAFPIPDLPFEQGVWHDVQIDYDAVEDEYAVQVDGALLDEGIPVYHPINAPIEVLGLRTTGESIQVALDDLAVTDWGDTTLALDLDFEDSEDGDEWVAGPYFVNDPPPAVFRYLTAQEGTTLLATLSDPSWLSIDGVAVGADRTLYVSVQEQDPADPTGVLRRGQIHRFSSTGEPLPALAGNGTGLGFVIEPRDLAFDGENLLVVDEALNRVQKLDPLEPNTAVFQIPPLDAEVPWFAGPTDVATDSERYIYVADTRNDRVFRCTPEGAFADTVYSPTYLPTESAGYIGAPSAIAATAEVVMIADPAEERLVFLKRAEEISGGGE